MARQIEQELKDFKIQQMLGSGSFATVYKGLNLKTNQTVAIKVFYQINLKYYQHIDKFSLEPDILPYIENEINLSKQIKSQYVVEVFQTFELEKSYYIIMELCDFDLAYAITQTSGVFSEQLTIIILKQLIKGLLELHKLNIIHRDIKMENIMVKFNDNQDAQRFQKNPNDRQTILERCTFKLCDFGVSKQLEANNLFTDTLAGSEMTQAPEIIGEIKYGFQVDVYSLGVVLYFMLYGDYPFKQQRGKNQYQIIKKHIINLGPNAPSQEIIKIILRMLSLNPENRITFQQLSQLFNEYEQNEKIKNNTRQNQEKKKKIKILAKQQESFQFFKKIKN